MKKFVLVAAISVIALFTAQSVNGQTNCDKTTIGGTIGIKGANVTAKVETTECENKQTKEVTVTTKGTVGVSTPAGGYEKSTESTKTYKDRDEKGKEDFKQLQEQIEDKRSMTNRMP